LLRADIQTGTKLTAALRNYCTNAQRNAACSKHCYQKSGENRKPNLRKADISSIAAAATVAVIRFRMSAENPFRIILPVFAHRHVTNREKLIKFSLHKKMVFKISTPFNFRIQQVMWQEKCMQIVSEET
jgi:hypothetical protein